MNQVRGRTVIRDLGGEENGSAIGGPVRPREELVKLWGELPRRASHRIENVELAVIIEFAYERDRPRVGRPGRQAPRRSGVSLDETSRRQIGEVKRVGVLGPAGACSDEEDVAGASQVVRAGREHKGRPQGTGEGPSGWIHHHATPLRWQANATFTSRG